MNFDLLEAVEVLERTPQTLEHFLSGLSDNWILSNEGEGTWTISQVIDHFIECEKTNWIPRLQVIVRGDNGAFPPFDRFSHIGQPLQGSLQQRFSEFRRLREENILKIKQMINSESHLQLTGVHPAFGEVKARELLSTWVVHDLTHISQIARIMAGRYREDVGPWVEYLGILKS
ncbi:DinB family protein [Bacillus sp. SCS-153A]|uniref:DinB family protein n=1 Tax=Rossellomorea sedimentorum TaxID=3115294 RepID=UPI003906D45D